MIVKVTLEQEDYDVLHDIVYDVTNIQAANAQLQSIWDMLPEDIQALAIRWGMSDTESRENIYIWVRDRFESEKKILNINID
jgi:hypothetical protein